MFARVTKFQSDASHIEEMAAMIPSIKEKIAAIEGGVANWAMWNADGTGLAVAIYESEAAADAAQEQIQGIWAPMAHLLIAPPEMTSFSKAENMRG